VGVCVRVCILQCHLIVKIYCNCTFKHDNERQTIMLANVTCAVRWWSLYGTQWASAPRSSLKRPRWASRTRRLRRPPNPAGCPPSIWANPGTIGPVVREWDCGRASAAWWPDGGRRRSTSGERAARAAAVCGDDGDGGRTRRRPSPRHPVRPPCLGIACRPAAFGASTRRPRPRLPDGNTGRRPTVRRPRPRHRPRRIRRPQLPPHRLDMASIRTAARRTVVGTPRSCPPRLTVPGLLPFDVSIWFCPTK